MSHFTVLVVTDNGSEDEVNHQLAPFHEYECTGVKDEFVKWVEPSKTKEELMASYEEARVKHGYKSYDEYMTDYHGYEKNEAGEYGRTTNPNAKWDWFTIGGRWDGSLLTKEGKNVNTCRRDELDLATPMKKYRDAAAKRWDIASNAIGENTWTPWVEMLKLHEKVEDARTAYHDQPTRKVAIEALRGEASIFYNYDEHLMKREDYINRYGAEANIQFAFLRDRAWSQRGEMGWFGHTMNEVDPEDWAATFQALLEAVPSDKYITVVDCHI